MAKKKKAAKKAPVKLADAVGKSTKKKPAKKAAPPVAAAAPNVRPLSGPPGLKTR